MNEEMNIPQNDNVEEIKENNESSKKALPLGAIVGIAAGAVAIVLAIVLIIVFVGNKNKCDGHVDADDDYLCDKCGENFDDGDEVVIPEDNGIEVIFTVKLDDGSILSGAKFTLSRNNKTYDLITDVNGTAKVNLAIGKYYLDFDQETLPEYCLCDVPGVEIKEDTTSIALKITNNKPDGSPEKPFPTGDEAIDITLAAGEELYYSCRGTSLRYVTVNSESLVINYNGETYTADEEGKVVVPVSSSDVETPTVFSIKNISDETVSALLDIYAPLGSYDNPHELTDNTMTVDVKDGETVYYVYRAEKNGIIVITSPTEGNEILISRNIIKITDGVEQVVSTITAESRGDSAGYIYVTEGDDIRIGVSYVEPKSDEVLPDTEPEQNEDAPPEVVTVKFSFNHYSATESDPAPILNDVYIRLDAGASVVFTAEIGKTISIETGDSVTLMYNGTTVTEGVITIAEETDFTVINPSDTLVIFTLKIN